MQHYDAIVIGAGNGGLTSALTIARGGKKVLLLERHNIPGGCATSFIRGRFEFEVALHQLSGMGTPEKPGPLRDVLSKLGVMDKLEFVEHQHLYRFIVPGAFDFSLKADREALINDLQKKFPKEKEAVKKFFVLVYDVCMQMVGGIYFKDPEFSKAKYPLYCKYALKNAQDVLDEFFTDPYLKAALSLYWGYTAVAPGKMPFSDLAIMLFAYLEFKPYHLKGGSQSMSNALLDGFLKAGGEARFNCEVKKIEVKNGKIAGVVTEDGEMITAGKVVSNASTVRTYIDLMDREDIPEDQLKAFKTMTIGPSAFTVYLGLDCAPEEIGLNEAANFITTEIDGDRAAASFRTFDNQGWCMLSYYNECGPEFSPAGTCQAAIVSLQYADPWYTVPVQQYHEMKYRCANVLIDVCNRAFPGLRDHIEEAEAATPLTHMRYLGHPGGAIYGQDQLAKDSKFFLSRRSPIPGLYFAGAWITMGGFEPTLEAGWSTGRDVLADFKKQ
jgi:prolycopene isomerase